jgi:hypothetical protein
VGGGLGRTSAAITSALDLASRIKNQVVSIMTMPRNAFRELIYRNFLVLGLSIPLVALPMFGLWVHGFFKDYRTGVYAVTFIVVIAMLMHVGIFRVRESTMRLASAGLRGAIAGYISGLVAYFILVFVISDGAATLGRTIGRDADTSIALIASFPLVLGGWLYGALVGLAVEWLRGRTKASLLH